MSAGYRALREGAALVGRGSRGLVAARGSDRARFLHGMLSCDVRGLQPGSGCYGFVLDPKGHILADLNLFCRPEEFLLECDAAREAALRAGLERFVVADDVALESRAATWASLGVEGPSAAEVLQAATGADLAGLAPWGQAEIACPAPLLAARCSWSGVQGYWLFGVPPAVAALRETLVADGRAEPAGEEDVELVRLEHGVPRHGRDFGEEHLPQETGLLHALCFTKGCYRGQEVVERVRSRGHVNRLLARLVSDAPPPPPGTPLREPETGKEVGSVTSAARSPALGRTVGLGWLRREWAAPGQRLRLSSEGTGAAEVEVRG